MASIIPKEILEQLGRFCNDINGSLAAGLAGRGDSGLKESEKLPLAQPHLILGSNNEQSAILSWTVIGSHVEQSKGTHEPCTCCLDCQKGGTDR